MTLLTPEQMEVALRPLHFELDLKTPCRFDDCYPCASGCFYLCTRRPLFRITQEERA